MLNVMFREKDISRKGRIIMIDFSKKKTKKQKMAAAIICILIVFGMVAGLLFAAI